MDNKLLKQVIARNFKTCRSKANLTLIQTGEALGISWQQASKYEKGQNHISAVKLFLAAKTFNVSVLDFYKGIDTFAPQEEFTKEHFKILKALKCNNNQEFDKNLLALIKTLQT